MAKGCCICEREIDHRGACRPDPKGDRPSAVECNCKPCSDCRLEYKVSDEQLLDVIERGVPTVSVDAGEVLCIEGRGQQGRDRQEEGGQQGVSRGHWVSPTKLQRLGMRPFTRGAWSPSFIPWVSSAKLVDLEPTVRSQAIRPRSYATKKLILDHLVFQAGLLLEPLHLR